MRSPVLDVAYNLQWTKYGTCWALFRVKGQSYGHRPVKDKRVVRDLHRALVRAFQGEALMLGVRVTLDAASVAERMLVGFDENNPAPEPWLQEVEATLEKFSTDPELELGRRVHYLAVPLANPGSRAWTAPFKATEGTAKEALGLPRAHPSQDEIQFRLEQSDRVQRAIPSIFDPKPLTVVEQVWLGAHQQSRGLQDISPETAVAMAKLPALDDDDSESRNLRLVSHSGVLLPEPILDPGARVDTNKRYNNPVTRRILKVTDSTIPDAQPSYQALMVMTATPPGGVLFPGSELLSRLDMYGADVDWAIRSKINSRDKVMRRNRQAVKKLNDQYDQRETENGEAFGLHDLDRAAKAMEQYQSIFAADQLEVEVEHTIILALGADTFEQADNEANDLIHALADADFKFTRPPGDEEALWWAMHPGVPYGQKARSYAHFTDSQDFSCLVPYVTAQLGDADGPVWAKIISSARPDVVHVNLTKYQLEAISASFAAAGETGGGKSYLGKTTAAQVWALDGQILAVDKDKGGEWARFLTTLDPDTVVVDMEDPKWSMDPLRINASVGDAAMTAEAFYTAMLSLNTDELISTTLGNVLHQAYLQQHHITSSRVLIDHLESDDCTLDEAKSLAQRIRTVSESLFGRLIFDDTLPAVPSTANVVWRTHTGQLPTKDEMEHSHLFDRMALRKKFTRAYYRLVMATARAWAFADDTRPCMFVNDEAYDMYSNPENVVDGEHFVKQGRRYLAFLAIFSHDPSEFGSERMRELIPTRFAFRHTDDNAAKACIRFIGIDDRDPEFEAMVEVLKKDTSPKDPATRSVPLNRRGECFMRDAYGNVEKVQVLGPARPDLQGAVSSTPGVKVA